MWAFNLDVEASEAGESSRQSGCGFGGRFAGDWRPPSTIHYLYITAEAEAFVKWSGLLG